MDKAKKIAVAAVFLLALAAMTIAWLIIPDKSFSVLERRVLSQWQNIEIKDVLNGRLAEKTDKYLADQAPMRDSFRSLKGAFSARVCGLGQNNGIYKQGDFLVRIEYPLNENQVLFAAGKMRDIAAAHPEAAGAYYAIIPDKCCFPPNAFQSIDYFKIAELVNERAPELTAIGLTDCLSMDNYYRTDIHWRQETLLPAAQLLCRAMGAPEPEKDDFTEQLAGNFLGVLAGRWAMPVKEDELVYLSSESTANAVVTFLGVEGEQLVYDLSAADGTEPYDMFLGGPQSIVEIENPQAQSDRELIIFRDSFASSLAPLLTGSYHRITLVDLRYITTSMAEERLDFENADLLFLYCAAMLNSGGILK